MKKRYICRYCHYSHFIFSTAAGVMADTDDENEAEQCASQNEGGKQAICNSTEAKQYTSYLCAPFRFGERKVVRGRKGAQAQSQVPLEKK